MLGGANRTEPANRTERENRQEQMRVKWCQFLVIEKAAITGQDQASILEINL